MGNKRGQGRATCSVDGCDRTVKGRRLCEKHYMRAYRHSGDVTAGEGRFGSGYVMSDGYVLITRPGHPLARAKNQVQAHRVVLYDAIGPGVHQCHWCKQPVEWGYGVAPGVLVVDHVDGNRQNNDISNLVPSCSDCNVRRDAQ